MSLITTQKDGEVPVVIEPLERFSAGSEISALLGDEAASGERLIP